MPSGAVTVAVTVQLPLLGIPPPERLMIIDPGVAMAVPPQVEVKPLGLATTKPAGSESVKATPVSATKLFGLVIEKLTVVVPPGMNLLGTNDLLITGGATTSRVADAVLPDPAILATTLPVTLFLTPAVSPVTVTLKVHDVIAGSVAPVRTIELEPVGAVTGVPLQEALDPLNTTTPGGKLSVNPTPARATGFGFVIVKINRAFAPSGIEVGLKILLMLGGPKTVKVADAVFPAPPSLDVTEVVVLFKMPAVVAVTFTLTVQVAPGTGRWFRRARRRRTG